MLRQHPIAKDALLSAKERHFVKRFLTKQAFCFMPEVLNPDGKTLQFRYLSALAAKFIDNIRINIDNIRINVDDFPAKLVPLD